MYKSNFRNLKIGSRFSTGQPINMSIPHKMKICCGRFDQWCQSLVTKHGKLWDWNYGKKKIFTIIIKTKTWNVHASYGSILLQLYGVFLSSWSMTAPGYHMLTSAWTFYFTFVSHWRNKLKLVLEQPENLDFWESLSFNKPARCTPIGSTKQIVDAIGPAGQ